jgi:hypothetical protein
MQNSRIMEKTKPVQRLCRRAAAGVALCALGATFAQQASAGCGQYKYIAPALFQGESWNSRGSAGFLRTGFLKTDFTDASPESKNAEPSITGLWHFKYFAKGDEALGIPDGAVVDGGNTTWFADGNEATYSGMRAPDTGAQCMGVWKKTGDRAYTLNHIGLSWDAVNNAFAGPAFIKQYVTLDKSGDKYTGTFTITQLGPDGKTVQVVIKGLIRAYRVTIDTDEQS